MKQTFLTIMILLSISTLVLATEHTATHIDYQTYLEEISRKLPEIMKNRVTTSRYKNNIKGAKAVDDVTFEADVNHCKTNQYTGADSAGHTTGENYSAGLSKKFSATGTTLSTGMSYTKNSNHNTTTYSGLTSYAPTLSLSITQPILYNFFGKIDRYDIQNTTMQYKIQKFQEQYDTLDTLNYYKKLYFNWAQYQEILEILRTSIKNAQVLSNQTRRKTKVGLAENDDYQQTRTSLYTYQAQYAQYEIYLKNIEKELMLYFPGEITPDKTSFEDIYAISVQTQYSMTPFDMTLMGKVYALTINNLKYQQDVYDNMQLPELNLYAEANKVDTTDTAADSYEVPDDTDLKVGFEFKYTLGNNEAESNLKDVELQLQELELDKKAASNEYTKSIYNVKENITRYQDLIKLRNKKLQALYSQLKTEQKKYKRARVTLSDVIETRDSIIAERVEIMLLKNQIIQEYIDYKDITR